MARPQPRFVCQSCGAVHNKWQGKCPDCDAWNSIVEEAGRAGSAAPKGLGGGKGRVIPFADLGRAADVGERLMSGISEFDRVVGGGLTPGGVLLVGGDPGIGKSTILLQVSALLGAAGLSCAYISGEEAASQVGQRARRLGLDPDKVSFAAETNLRDILTTLEADPPAAVVIDSIQTMFVDTLEAGPGSITQVRASTQELVRYAKASGSVVMIVGHVTKDGQIAGPRVMEHMVDTVLYFEGDRGHQYRILRTVKNRFGGTDEIGVFEMTGTGLKEVKNPSSLFLGDREEDVPGTSVYAGIEGTRPVLVEFQALVAPSPAANPRRTVVGWDPGRLAMILAVLDARCGLGLAASDVYLNVAGGLKVTEPGADLAAAAALLSSLSGRSLPGSGVVFGEISLSGRVRPVGQSAARLKEAAKLGFDAALVPAKGKTAKTSLRLVHIDKLAELIDLFELGGEKR